MANEVQISATLRYSESPVSTSLSTSFFADQTGDKFMSGVQSVGTAEESLDKGDIVTIGYIAVQNLDATNYVQFGITTGVYTVKLLPGKGCVMPWNGQYNYIKANTAACNVNYLMTEL
jgi:hypothetical protein